MILGTFITWLLNESLRSLLLTLLVAPFALGLISLAAVYIAYPLLKKSESSQKKKPDQKGAHANGSLDFADLGPKLTQAIRGSNRREADDFIFRSLQQDGLEEYAWLERLWCFSPPVGPAHSLGRASPPFSKAETLWFSIYVVEISVNMNDGTIQKVMKPGITCKSDVIGPDGRYSIGDGIDRIVLRKRGLTPMQAWTVEQKMLALMPQPIWKESFEQVVDRQFGLYEWEAEAEPLISKKQRSRLGPTEWRQWNLGDEVLKATLDQVVRLTPA